MNTSEMFHSRQFYRITLLLLIIYSIGIPSIVGSNVDTCSTPECLAAEQLILKSMNKDANPCDNFYEFACGKFVKETPIPKDQSFISTIHVVADTLYDQLKTIFSQPIVSSENKAFGLLKGYYQACMRVESTYNDGDLEPIKEAVHNIGGWPVRLAGKWKEDTFDWQKTSQQLRNTGFSSGYFLQLFVETDFKYPYRKIVSIDQITFEIARSHLIEGRGNAIVEAYYNYMVDMAAIFQARRVPNAIEEMNATLDFEIALAKITEPEETRQNLSQLYNPMNIKSLQQKYPGISWLEYVNNILSPITVNLSEKDLLNIKNPQYISDLLTLLKNTPKRTVANYMVWRAYSSVAQYVNEKTRNCRLKFDTILSGKQEREPRWKECIRVVEDNLMDAAGLPYIKRYFSSESKKNVSNLVFRIRSQGLGILEKADWIRNNDTRARATKKMYDMPAMIGYEENIYTKAVNLGEYFEKLKIIPEDYLQSYLNLNKFQTDHELIKILYGFPEIQTCSNSNPATLCGGYDLTKNKLILSAGLLQPPIYLKGRPAYLNFGQLGTIIGHEIMHGFDDKGSQFDENGALTDWWDVATKEEFERQSKCYTTQYDNYQNQLAEKHPPLQGWQTLGENLADNGGMKLAYNAYRAWSAKYGPEPKLPNLQQYTDQQMFWINAAITYCTKYTPEYYKNIAPSSVHSPAEFRVRGSLSNNEDFARDFNCKVDSKINPNGRCKVW